MMLRYHSISLVLASLTAGVTLRAATEPHAASALEAGRRWTNEHLERLGKIPDLISIVATPTSAYAQDQATPDAKSETRDPSWYAAQAASLNAQLESEQAQLRNFTQAPDDVRELKTTGGAVDLFQVEVALTPEVTIDVLQNRVRETQSELDALEDYCVSSAIRCALACPI